VRTHFALRLQPYGKVLSSAGNSLKEILTNINTMHGHIKMGYFSEVPSPSSPSEWWCHGGR
jgi:hypothetical protein